MKHVKKFNENQKIIIKVNAKTEFELDIDPDTELWEEANEESRNIYIRERIEEYLQDNMDEILDDLLENSEIKII